MPTQQKPIIHGRDHACGGADPIPGLCDLFPGTTGDFPGYVLSLSDLIGYWRLGESASPFADTSGVTPAADLQRVTFTVAMDTDVAGALPAEQDDGAIEFLAANTQHGDRLDLVDDTTGDRFELGGNPYTVACWIKLIPDIAGTFTALIVGTWEASGGWYLGVNYPTQQIFHFRQAYGGSPQSFAQGPAVDAGSWLFVVATWDSVVGHELFYNGASVASDPGTTIVPEFALSVGAVKTGGPNFGSYPGALDELAIWSRVLTGDEIAALYAHGVGAVGEADEGDVLTSDGEGGTTWAPPSIEITTGGGDADDTQHHGGNPGLGPVSDSGYHLWQHVESVVLYDSTPGRFDVPSRKWVRVPFNSVRVYRRWEPEPDSDIFTEAWLPDDRDLTMHARDGLLHVNADMVGLESTSISGYYSIEYPVLDYLMLPDDDPEVAGGGPRPSTPGTDPIVAYDAYVRAARLVNVTRGSIIRESPGSHWRLFFEWLFSESGDSIPINMWYDVDNPYPQYPIWHGRPLNMTLPYAKTSPSFSRSYYLDSVGNPGFLAGNLSAALEPQAGDNICLQAWQDAPWPLRFSTNHFPNFDYNVLPDYKNRPHLALTFNYDPDTIDHATGKLLL